MAKSAPLTFKTKEIPQTLIPELLESEDAKIAFEGVKAMLRLCGEDTEREGLSDTPRRVIKAFLEMTSGMYLDPTAVLGTVFKEGINYDEMVVLINVKVWSLCEHHLLPFSVICDIGYIPNPEIGVLGLSKLVRLAEILANRPQVQERLTVQIAETLEQALKPLGVAVRIRGEHQCVACRGVKKTGAVMVTQVLTGAFKNRPETRAEWIGHLNY